MFQSFVDTFSTLLNLTASKDEVLFSNIMVTSTDDEIIALLDARDNQYVEFAVTYDLIDILLLELYDKHILLRSQLREINRCHHYEDLINEYQTLGFQIEAQKLTIVFEYGKEENMRRYGVTNTVRTPFDFDDI
ncbi:hypothetical protein C9J21_18570 [Photobacterium phosphoreum]|nr:hypothetical protein C9J21_18570 [Photobacterium phosphoreum]